MSVAGISTVHASALRAISCYCWHNQSYSSISANLFIYFCFFFSSNLYEPHEIDSSGISTCSDHPLSPHEIFPFWFYFQWSQIILKTSNWSNMHNNFFHINRFSSNQLCPLWFILITGLKMISVQKISYYLCLPVVTWKYPIKFRGHRWRNWFHGISCDDNNHSQISTSEKGAMSQLVLSETSWIWFTNSSRTM